MSFLVESRFINFLRRVVKILADTEDPVLIGLANEGSEIIKLASDTIRIVVAGPYNAGKSTLINALLKAEVMPTNVVRETITVNRLVYGEQYAVEVFYRHALLPPERINCNRVEEIMPIIINFGRHHAKEISHIDIYYPLEFLRRFTIIDTPGYDFSDEDTAKLSDAIETGDLIIWLTQHFYQNEHKKLKELKDSLVMPPQVVVLLNYIDLYTAKEIQDNLEHIKKGNQEVIDEIFPISALEALQGELKKDMNLLEKSRFNIFSYWLNQNVIEKFHENLLEKIKTHTFRYFEKAKEVIGTAKNNIKQYQQEVHEKTTLIQNELNEAIRQFFLGWPVWYSEKFKNIVGNKLTALFFLDMHIKYIKSEGIKPLSKNTDFISMALDVLAGELSINEILKGIEKETKKRVESFSIQGELLAKKYIEFHDLIYQITCWLSNLPMSSILAAYILGAIDYYGINLVKNRLEEDDLYRNRLENITTNLTERTINTLEHLIQNRMSSLINQYNKKYNIYQNAYNNLLQESSSQLGEN